MFARACLFAVIGCLALVAATQAQTDESAADRVAAATKRLANKQEYQLQYKLQAGEEIRWTVEHVVSTKVQMAGSTEESSSRSNTVKKWRVANVDSLGNITFVHSIESIDMWQKVGEEDPITYNSQKDEEVPAAYQSVAEKVGKPLVVFSITPQGEVIDRKSSLQENSFGVGKVTVPLPKEAIPVGHQWHVPTLLEATDENGTNRKLKARILYELAKVNGPHAYIKFRTEVLTPVKSEKIKSTIMQQMTDGYLVFDIERGRPVLKQVEWDEKAAGFEGGDSLLTYVGRMSEKLVEGSAEASAKQAALDPIESQDADDVQLKTRHDPPMLRK